MTGWDVARRSTMLRVLLPTTECSSGMVWIWCNGRIAAERCRRTFLRKGSRTQLLATFTSPTILGVFGAGTDLVTGEEERRIIPLLGNRALLAIRRE